MPHDPFPLPPRAPTLRWWSCCRKCGTATYNPRGRFGLATRSRPAYISVVAISPSHTSMPQSCQVESVHFLSLAQLSLISPAQSSGHNPLSRGVRLSTLWLYSSQAGRCARDGGFENNMRMGRFFGAKRVTGIVAAKLGHCPRCMRQSFVIAVIAWVCAMAACAMARPVLTITFGILALGLSGLWLAHLATFAARVVVKVERNADSATNDPASSRARMPRRQFFRTFAKAFTFAAIATAVSTRTALACVQPPIACTKHSDCTCSGCCGDMDGIHLCQPSC